MANPEQLKLLKQGIDAWNAWRKNNPDQNIDLTGAILGWADLVGADLVGADLYGANLDEAHLRRANLRVADLRDANLTGADLGGANLREANLMGANLMGANLMGANLMGADLREANLREAHLMGADLREANLMGTDLNEANLTRANLNEANLSTAALQGVNIQKTDLSHANLSWANLSRAYIGSATLVDIDLSETLGLEDARYSSSSSLSINTMVLSKGKIPEVFLRGCGLSDWEIEAAKLYDPDLPSAVIDEILYKVHDLRANRSIQISPLFISYSHADSQFVDVLEDHLNGKGIRFWRDIHDATSGRLETQIDRAIRLNSTVLLILSENSIKSDWVEHEVRLARELEKETQRDVLCPVALDDGWKTSPWPKRLMEQVMEYNILDFSKWKDYRFFKNTFVRLIDGLNLYYKKQS